MQMDVQIQIKISRMNHTKNILLQFGLIASISFFAFIALFVPFSGHANAAICIDCGGGGWGGGGGGTAPLAPTMSLVTALSSSMLSITFTDNSTNETGFRLYRDGALLYSMNSTTGTGQQSTSYDYGLTCGITHSYYAEAYNTYGATKSASMSGVTPCPLPTPAASNSATTFPCAAATCQDSTATNFNGPLPCAYGNPPPPPYIPTSDVSSTLNVFSRDDTSLYLNWADTVTSTAPYTFEVQRIKLTPENNTNFNASSSGTIATLTWKNSTAATPYYVSIERSTETNQAVRFYSGQDTTLTTVNTQSYRPWNGSALVPQSSGSYVDTTIHSGTVYYYRIRACSEITPPYMQTTDGAQLLNNSLKFKPNPVCSPYSYGVVTVANASGVSPLALKMTRMINNVVGALSLVPDATDFMLNSGDSVSFVVHKAVNLTASVADSVSSFAKGLFAPAKTERVSY